MIFWKKQSNFKYNAWFNIIMSAERYEYQLNLEKLDSVHKRDFNTTQHS